MGQVRRASTPLKGDRERLVRAKPDVIVDIVAAIDGAIDSCSSCSTCEMNLFNVLSAYRSRCYKQDR